MATQAQNLVHLGVTKFLIVGTAGGLATSLDSGDVVLVNAAVRDDGVSHHFLEPARYAHPSPELTSRLRDALTAPDVRFIEGRSWTVAVPFRMTKPELETLVAEDRRCCRDETAALFAVAEALGAQAAAAVTLTDVTTTEGRMKEGWAATRNRSAACWMPPLRASARRGVEPRAGRVTHRLTR